MGVSSFQMTIGGEAFDTSSALSTKDVTEQVRNALLRQAADHRAKAEALRPSVEAASERQKQARDTLGTLLPELAEELDKPWDAAAFARSAVGRYADARRIRDAEVSAKMTITARQRERAQHAAGGWCSGLKTVEYAEATEALGRLRSQMDAHTHAAHQAEERAKRYRAGMKDTTYVAVDLRKEAAARRAKSRPSKTAFAPGSWVRWTDPGTDTVRFGVVTDDGHVWAGPSPKVACKRYIVPADGGEPLAMAPRGKATSGDWRCQRPEWAETVDVLPALAQETLFDVAA